MIYAQKGNKLRQIAEADIQTYVEQGYKIVDGQGTVLKETVPTDLATLRSAYVKHKDEIKALTARNDALVREINALKNAKPAKAEKVVETTEATEAKPEKKTGRKAQ